MVAAAEAAVAASALLVAPRAAAVALLVLVHVASAVDTFCAAIDMIALPVFHAAALHRHDFPPDPWVECSCMCMVHAGLPPRRCVGRTPEKADLPGAAAAVSPLGVRAAVAGREERAHLTILAHGAASHAKCQYLRGMRQSSRSQWYLPL